MFQHHLRIVLRNLKRHKGAFLINLLSLSTGMACALLIYLWVTDEMHFDKFSTHHANLYQVIERSTENGQVLVHESTQGPLGAAMEKDFPEVTGYTTVMSMVDDNLTATIHAGNKMVKTSGLFASPSFFDLFSFKLLQGQPSQVLADDNGMVLSATTARALFGSVENAMGKTVQWEFFGRTTPAIITGVMDQLPGNSSLQFDFALTYNILLKGVGVGFSQWYNEGPRTYLLMRPGTDMAAFNHKFSGYLKKYAPGTVFTLEARSYSSAYLHGRYVNGIQQGGRIEYVHLFSLVAIFILVIGCINFMNLSTARASRRMKEVGIKKAVGATRNALVRQFLSEALLMTLLSLALALLIVVLLLPAFNQVTGKQVQLQFTPSLMFMIVGATLLTGLLAGSYPAFYLSGFNPVSILKGRLAQRSWGELLARKGLVVIQFVVSLVLIVAVLVIYRQVSFIQSKNLGYDKDHLIQFDREGDLVKNTPAFLEALRKTPGVINASGIQETVVSGPGGGSGTFDVDWPGKPDHMAVSFIVRSVEMGMIETMGLQLKEGRAFSPQYGADSAKLVFNETAIKLMGLQQPVGTHVRLHGKDYIIAGVVKDFNISSLHEDIKPMLFEYNPGRVTMFMVRVAAGQEKQGLENIAAVYKQFNPDYAFEYHFLDKSYQAQYVSEQRIATLSRYFAGLAILISCLGLFGLATFNAEVRTKEIGIRKVLGASTANVIVLLTRDFVKLACIAMLLAFPLAWWAMHNWLNNFAYHIPLGADLFLLSAAAIICITLFTVSYQSAKAALANPARSLQSE